MEKEQVSEGERAEVTGESQLCLPAQINPLGFQKLPDNITQQLDFKKGLAIKYPASKHSYLGLCFLCGVSLPSGF